MTSDPLTDVVSRQYQQWVYPEPIPDLAGWLEGNWEWFDPSHAHTMLWPDRDHLPGTDILVAGCGANQAAVLAYTNPDARIVAVDVSQPSLDHHLYLRERHGLRNLDVHLLPIEDVATLERDFDLIVSTGVLHHLADPGAGMAALAGCLRRDGVLAAMLYARNGRRGVEMLQAAFREMGLIQDAASLAVVKDTLARTPPDHPIRSYMSVAPDLQYDAGLVDTFLHGRDRSYTVDDCLGLVDASGLTFVDWFLKAPYYPPVGADDLLDARLATLPRERQWSVMESISPRNACHFFTACRPDRPKSTYRIDFASPEFVEFIPSLRYRCELRGDEIRRSDWGTPLDRDQLVLLHRMDGQRTIGQIASGTGVGEQYARELFQSLWQLDIVAMGLRPHAHPPAPGG